MYWLHPPHANREQACVVNPELEHYLLYTNMLTTKGLRGKKVIQLKQISLTPWPSAHSSRRALCRAGLVPR